MRVFLSYSRSDRAFVDRFADDLGRAGIEVWCDVDALRGGEFADFEVPAPAIGNFVLVVRQQTNTAEIPFTLS